MIATKELLILTANEAIKLHEAIEVLLDKIPHVKKQIRKKYMLLHKLGVSDIFNAAWQIKHNEESP